MDLRVYVNARGVEASMLVAWPEWVVLAAQEEEDAADEAEASGAAEAAEAAHSFGVCFRCASASPGPASAGACPHCAALSDQYPGDPARVYRQWRLRSLAAPTAGTGAAPDGSEGPAQAALAPLVRVHDACATSELFGSVKCDCAHQLRAGLAAARAEAGSAGVPGALIYLPQEGRGIGLAAKTAAYALQAAGADTVDANRLLGLPDDSRSYDAAADALRDSGLEVGGGAGIRLLSNNPRKREQLTLLGVRVQTTVPHLVASPSAHSTAYLRAKAERMGHVIPDAWLASAPAGEP